MKRNNHKFKGKKISFSLITAPFLVFLFIVIASPIVVYLYHDNLHFASYHKDIIFSSMKQKKDKIEQWFVDKKGVLELIAADPKFKSNMGFLLSPVSEQTKKGLKNVVLQREQGIGDLKKIIFAEVESKAFSLISIISKEGSILLSSTPDLIGTSLAETDLFKKLISTTDRTIFLGFWQDAGNGYEIDIVTPLRDEQGGIYGYLHGAVNISELASIVSEFARKSMVFEIVDRQGSILISPETKFVASKRYSPLILETNNALQYHEGAIVNVSQLKNLNLFLIQRADTFRILYPFFEVIFIYSLFVLLGFILFLYQAIYVRGKISKPLISLLSSVRSSAAGVRSVVVQKRYPYEIDSLIKAVQQMINEFVFPRQQSAPIKESSVKESPVNVSPLISDEKARKVGSLRAEEIKDNTSPIISLLGQSAIELKALVHKDLSCLFELGDSGKECEPYTLRRNIIMLSCVIDNYKFLQAYKDGIIKLNKSVIKAQDIFDEITGELGRLKEAWPIETVLELDSSISSLSFEADRGILLRIIINILYNAFSCTAEGTITVVFSRNTIEDGSSWLTLYISDTGYGYDNNEIEYIKKGESAADPALSSAFMLADISGQDISVDSLKGRGSVYILRQRIDR